MPDTDLGLLKQWDFSVSEILDRLEVGIMVVDRDYRIVAANRRFLRIHGARAGGKAAGRACYALSFGRSEPCPAGRCAVRRAFADGRAHTSAMLLGQSTRRERALELHAFPLRDRKTGEVAAVMEIVYDKTGEYESEKIRNRLLTVAAHELRRPLNAIAQLAGCLENRRRMKLGEKDVDGMLARIRNRAAQAALDLETLLKMHKFLSGSVDLEKRRANLYREAVEPVLRAYAEPLARKGMVAMLDVPRDAEAECDPSLLRMAVENLLDNAVKYAREETPVLVRHERSGGAHRLSVASCAPHIRDAARLFEPFATRETGGTGLGLPFCRAVMKAHRGSVRVEHRLFDGEGFRPVPPAKRAEGNEAEWQEANAFCLVLPE